MALFNKKKEDMMQPPPPNPNQMVNSMRSQGMNNNQISQNMQRDGYNMGQINSAMNGANMGSPNMPGPMPGQYMQPPPMDSGGYDESSLNNAQFEEVAESIIEEKWNELMKNVNKIIEWKNQMDSRFTQIETKFTDLQHNFDELHKAVIAKINDYDQNILNVGSQVQAMEKVFSKVLPTFTDTVSELGRITNFVKDGKAPKKRKVDEDMDIPHDLLHNL